VNNDMAYENRESTVSIEKLIEENISDANILMRKNYCGGS